MQRQVVKEMLAEWDKKFPGRLESMFKAVTNIASSQLADRNLFDFAGLEAKQAELLAGRIQAFNVS
jgi:tRNA 2-thiocytidine biosynthesis protein TtcA